MSDGQVNCITSSLILIALEMMQCENEFIYDWKRHVVLGSLLTAKCHQEHKQSTGFH